MHMQDELLKIKDEVLNKIVLMSAIFFGLPYFVSLLRWYELGWHYIYAFHTVIYALTLFLAFNRRKINYYKKTIITTFLYLLIAIFGLLNFALSGGFYYAIISMAILAILTKKKIAITINLVIIALFSLIAIGYTSYLLSPAIDLNILARSPSHWFLTIFSLFSITIIFIFGFGDFYTKLSVTILEKEKVTSALRQQKELHETTEKKYSMLFESANDAIFLIKNYCFIDCNEKTCEYFQLEKDELIGKNILELTPINQYDGQKSSEKASQIYREILLDKSQKFEWQHLKSNGELFHASISLNKIVLQGEIYIQAILRNVTEQKRKDIELSNYRDRLENLGELKTAKLAEANIQLYSTNQELMEKNKELKEAFHHLKETQTQLLQSEKMASIGVLTAGVAHEINNPLNFMKGAYEGLKEYHENDRLSEKNEEIKLYIDALKTGINRTTAIVQGLTQFSRSSKSYSEECNINTIIENTLTILNNKIKDRVEITKELKDEVIILGNIGEIHQVFINLISNSVDAITENGRLTIKTIVSAKKLVIEISDNGCGINPEDLNKITDPFFTTKAPGKGTGLGLSISYKIIEHHNGKLEFESEMNKGTVARLIFDL